jgi:hypothetical protein
VIPDEGLKPLLVLCGWAQSGKDTLADYLVDHHGYTKRSYGETIVGLLEEAGTWVPDETGKAVRLSSLILERGYEESKKWKPARLAMQDFGTMLNRISPTLLGDLLHERAMGERVVITGGRSRPQIATTAKFGGISVWVSREGCVPANDHPNELALEARDCDYQIENNGTISQAQQSLLAVLRNP